MTIEWNIILLTFKKYIMSKKYTQLSLIDFIQLPSGKWAGHTLSGVYVTVNTYESGEMPNRFKYESWNKASKDEAAEYEVLHTPISEERKEAARLRDEYAYSEGYSSYESMVYWQSQDCQ